MAAGAWLEPVQVEPEEGVGAEEAEGAAQPPPLGQKPS